MTKYKRNILKVFSVGIACVLVAGCTVGEINFRGDDTSPSGAAGKIGLYDGSLDTNVEDYFDSSVVYKLPDTIEKNQDISVIVEMSVDSVLDSYKDNADGKLSVAEYRDSKKGVAAVNKIERKRAELVKMLNKSGISYKRGETYDTVLSGFEITVKAHDFDELQKLLGSKATLIVGEEYEAATAEVVENDVNVYSTDIFDSSDSEYQGNGVVIAVLDTGLDYTHTAFSVNNFATPDEDLAFTLGDGSERDVAKKVGATAAATFTSGLTGEDVYVSKKVPYAYDYADKDPDVLPINSSHGTHVAGIIAGQDDTITGVAPNAQLAIMKVFSDSSQGAKTSWILAALEDCVTLGVDVINMSLGTSCGFSREVDEREKNEIYDNIKEAGISLIAAASNDYNATFSSEKNGNLGLTSNPDSGTVGAPSTYDAALSVASISGVKTPYLTYEGKVMYFKEANDKASKPKNFVNDILAENENEKTFEYVTISGFGSAVDYNGLDVRGKIALVKRGTTSFEDKAKAASDAGAAGVIIYNNVSGEISMAIGSASAPVCSISQDDGELLAKSSTGKIKISRDQVAGPFMSDFSSWGPTSDLKIKPEITAHGGDILSAVPGQGYEKLSGTSMAAPNQAGVTSLIRQYVKEYVAADASDTKDVTALVNQIMMSTTDIAYNKIGLPYAVRKQGAGLANLTKATTTPAYLTTFEGDRVMDKTKLELKDDKNKTGVYEMTFAVNNISQRALTYDVDALVLTEGVSSTYTTHGETTVTEEGYLLDGADRKVTSVSGDGTANGNTVTVDAGGTLKVTVTVTLSDKDKQYLDKSFENGMYVEGFVTLTASGSNGVNLNVPFLAFYGDWTQAPIFDEEFFDTNADELDAGIDAADKVMADAYPTKVIGGLYSDYISYLGSYYFKQDPSATQIAAQRDHVALSNQNNGEKGNTTINSLSSIWAGMLRNAKRVEIKVVEDSTGEVVFSKTNNNQRKSYSSGGSIYYSPIEVGFDAIEQNLKNNTQYTVTVDAYIDWDGEQKNKRSRIEFPLYMDFEAPLVTDVKYRTVYDKINKETKLYADLSIYDNHYAMAVNVGQVTNDGKGFSLSSFGKYLTPVYSSFNSTSVVTVELTDYINQLKESDGLIYHPDGTTSIDENNNTFVASVYDYAMNNAIYEIPLPDDLVSVFFEVDADAKKSALNDKQIAAGNIAEGEQVLVMSPNETFKLTDILQVYPSSTWVSALDYSVSDEKIIGVVNGTVVARASGDATITVKGKNGAGEEVSATLDASVLSPEDTALGYMKYDAIAANRFEVTGFTTDDAFIVPSNDDRTIGFTGSKNVFGPTLEISMYPSEQVTLDYVLDSYFPDRTKVEFSSSREDIASVDENGTITAKYTANRDTKAYIAVSLLLDDKQSTSVRIAVTVKNPFINNSIYLSFYRGAGDENNCVVIPDDLGITTIYQYAFSSYEFVEKDLENGDVITEEDPYHLKQHFVGNDKIKKVIIPEGVTEIAEYAFANCTSLEEVVLPSTLKKIGFGAFYNCTSLSKINLEDVQFINKEAFYKTAVTEANFSSVVSFGDYAFRESKLNVLSLPSSCQSIGVGAFYGCADLANVTFDAEKVKVGNAAFAGCKKLTSVSINAVVISPYAFNGCTELSKVTLGKDVSVIGEYAFAGTKVAKFRLDPANTALSFKNGDDSIIYKNNGTQLLLAAPASATTRVTTDATSISTGAFSGNTNLISVVANNVTEVGDYAFSDCAALAAVTMNKLKSAGNYAFFNTAITKLPNAAGLTSVGDYAFAGTRLSSVAVPDNANVGNYAFAGNGYLKNATLGNGVTLGEGAFFKTALVSVTAGSNAKIGAAAFNSLTTLTSVTLGEGAQIGDYAFQKATALTSIDLSKVKSIGEGAFNLANGLTSVELTNLEALGIAAFYGASGLTSVVFGDKLTSVAENAFYGCTALKNVTLSDSIVELGAYAFTGAIIEDIDLEHVTVIGEGALALTPITSVTLYAEGVKIGDAAFNNCEKLVAVNNLDKAVYIGNYAFVNTALESANLESAAYIGDFAFANTKLTSVSFGVTFDENGKQVSTNKLQSLGENPFSNCAIETYAVEADVYFNGNVVGTELIDTYAVSDSVKVISGVLYQNVPNGLELVSYPKSDARTSFVVEEGTVRIGANAFMGSALKNVTIASTVTAIGDKAFYTCEALRMVVFKGYKAPVLEETYDESYINTLPIPYEGYFSFTGSDKETYVVEGLGISKYYMWNVTSMLNNFYYGANFVNYVGRVTDKLIMVKPVNGLNYDSFIFSQYFGTKVEGSTAADQTTLAAIAAIAEIPDEIVLTPECEALVAAARTAYDRINTDDQRALVTNVSRLTDAERRLEYLKSQQIIEPVKPETPDEKSYTAVIVVSVCCGVAVIGGAIAAFFILRARKNKGKPDGGATETTVETNESENGTDVDEENGADVDTDEKSED